MKIINLVVLFILLLTGVSYACVPAFHLFYPLAGSVIVYWALILITARTDGETKWHKVFLTGGLFLMLVLCSAPMFFLFGIPVILYYYVVLLQTLYRIISDKFNKTAAILVYPVGVIVSFLMIYGFSKPATISSYLHILVYLLKLGLATVGLFLLHTLIRRTGIPEEERKKSLVFSSAILLTTFFLIYIFKFYYMLNGNLLIYLNILETKMATYTVVASLLFIGALVFIFQEIRAKKVTA